MSDFTLTGRTALVTGGGRGIGRAISEGMLAAGARVVVLQRGALDPALVSYAADGMISAHAVDLADADGLDSVIEAVLDRHRIDILVNNAGTQFRAPAVDFPLDRFDEVLEVNLRSAFRLCQAFGRPMLERGAGKIVNIASLLSFQGGITVPAYAASKGAIAQLTKALCNEWAVSGVNVNAVAPGYVDTDLNTALRADPERDAGIIARIPAGRWGTGRDVAGAAVFLSSSAADYINGVVLPVDGGWLAR